jgi:site-specific DNA-adenine methylase
MLSWIGGKSKIGKWLVNYYPKDMEIYTAPEGDKIDRRKQDDMIKSYETERNDEKNQFYQTINELNSRIAMGDSSVMPKWLGSNSNL